MDPLERIRELAACSQDARVPNIDVRGRVQATLRESARDMQELVDRPTLAFAGLSMAVAALLFTFFLPTVQILWDPWLAFMNAPWSY